MKNIQNALIAALAAAALITPSLASAQDASYADNGANQQIQGTISSIDGTWNLTVNDANGDSDSVALHQGTIINPTGLTLEDGMSVTIDGYADGPNFDAIEIDTPYQYQGPAPVAVYYGPGTWYPGYANGWGPSFSLVFNSGRFEQRSFSYGGQIRRPLTPPSGWQNSPHGFIGNAGNRGFQRTAYAPQQQRSFARPQEQRGFAAPQQQRNFAAPQQQRNFAAPQQQRNFAAPQQQRNFEAPQQQTRSFAAPQQPAHNFAAPQQQRSFAAPPQQTRSFAAPQQPARNFAAPQQQHSFASPPQQTRSFAAPQQRSFAAPASRAPAPVARSGRDNGDHHR
jgi:hypothetical protein